MFQSMSTSRDGISTNLSGTVGSSMLQLSFRRHRTEGISRIYRQEPTNFVEVELCKIPRLLEQSVGKGYLKDSRMETAN